MPSVHVRLYRKPPPKKAHELAVAIGAIEVQVAPGSTAPEQKAAAKTAVAAHCAVHERDVALCHLAEGGFIAHVPAAQ